MLRRIVEIRQDEMNGGPVRYLRCENETMNDEHDFGQLQTETACSRKHTHIDAIGPIQICMDSQY